MSDTTPDPPIPYTCQELLESRELSLSQTGGSAREVYRVRWGEGIQNLSDAYKNPMDVLNWFQSAAGPFGEQLAIYTTVYNKNTPPWNKVRLASIEAKPVAQIGVDVTLQFQSDPFEWTANAADEVWEYNCCTKSAHIQTVLSAADQASADENQPDCLAINYDGMQINGCDIEAPAFSIQVTKLFGVIPFNSVEDEEGAVTTVGLNHYIAAAAAIIGKINTAEWLKYSPHSLLMTQARFQRMPNLSMRGVYEFQYSPSNWQINTEADPPEEVITLQALKGQTIATPDVGGIAITMIDDYTFSSEPPNTGTPIYKTLLYKGGWDLAWFRQGCKNIEVMDASPDVPITGIAGAHVCKVYKDGDFTTLGLVGGD